MTRVLVTGGAGGIGLATVRRLATDGAEVVATDLPDALEALSHDDRRLARWQRLDVTDATATDALVARVAEEGGLDGLVCSAGVLASGPSELVGGDDYRRMLEVNALGVIHANLAAVPHLRRQGSGSIVNVASNSARIARAGMAGYAASKAAVVAFTRSLALELAPAGIRCNCVSPGSTDTPMLQDLWEEGGGERATVSGDLGAFRPGIPVGRLVQPADVAEVIAWLLGPAPDHLTMQDLLVDGGAALGA